MLAVRFDRFGPPTENLQIQEVPKPTLTAEEVLVEVHAAGVNPSDTKNVLGNMENTTLPRTPGRDFAGIVVEGPKDLVGKEVWGTGGDIGFTRDGLMLSIWHCQRRQCVSNLRICQWQKLAR